MLKYRLEVLGVSKMKLKGNGARAVGEGVFFGVQDGRAKAGVAVSFKLPTICKLVSANSITVEPASAVA